MPKIKVIGQTVQTTELKSTNRHTNRQTDIQTERRTLPNALPPLLLLGFRLSGKICRLCLQQEMYNQHSSETDLFYFCVTVNWGD